MSNSIHSRLIYHSKVISMRFRNLLSILSCILLTITISVQNTSAEEITIDELRSVPVFHKGRIKPFDSYAKEMLEQICNTTQGKVTLDVELYFPAGYKTEELQGVADLFPEPEMN